MIKENIAIDKLFEDNKALILEQISKDMIEDYEYYTMSMEDLEYSYTDAIAEYLKSYNEDTYNKLSQIVDFDSLDVKLIEWDFNPLSCKINDVMDNFDSYENKLAKYLELDNNTNSNAYKFLKFANANNWELCARGLFGKYWITVYTTDFNFDIKSDTLTNDILNTYIALSTDVTDLIESVITDSMSTIDSYYYSIERAQDIYHSKDTSELLELYNRAYKAS